MKEREAADTLKKHKEAIVNLVDDLKGIIPSISMHNILMEKNADFHWTSKKAKSCDLGSRKKEMMKWLNVIYAIFYSLWVSLIHVDPKKGGITVISNEKNELVPTRTVTGLKVCIDYKKNQPYHKKGQHPHLFIDQMLAKLAGHSYYCFVDG